MRTKVRVFETFLIHIQTEQRVGWRWADINRKYPTDRSRYLHFITLIILSVRLQKLPNPDPEADHVFLCEVLLWPLYVTACALAGISWILKKKKRKERAKYSQKTRHGHRATAVVAVRSCPAEWQECGAGLCQRKEALSLCVCPRPRDPRLF